MLSAVFVKDVFPAAEVDGKTEMLAIGSTLLFIANDARHGIELWKSNGRPSGTQLVRDISPGSANSYPRDLVNFDGLLFFTAITPDAGRELWRSDGTTEGTFLVKDIYPGATSSNITEMTQVGEQLFFAASDPKHGIELWKTNGRSKGTVLVKDIYPGTDDFGYQHNSSPTDLVNWNGVLFFQTRHDDSLYTQVFKSDGTESGTAETRIRYLPRKDTFFLDRHQHTFLYVSDFIARTDGYSISMATVPLLQQQSGVEIPKTAVVGGIMYFAAYRGLWRTDGTANGTYRIIRRTPDNLRAAGSKLLFEGGDFGELWVSDGTTAGTMAIKRPSDGIIGDDTISDLTDLDGIFYCLQFNTLRRLDAGLTSISGGLDSEQIDFCRNLINVGGTLMFTSSGPFAHPRGGLYRFVPDE